MGDEEKELAQIMEKWLDMLLEGLACNWYEGLNPYPQSEEERIRGREQLGTHPLDYLTYQGWPWKKVAALNGKACAAVIFALMKRDQMPAAAMRVVMAYFFWEEYDSWHPSIKLMEAADGMHNLRFDPPARVTA